MISDSYTRTEVKMHLQSVYRFNSDLMLLYYKYQYSTMRDNAFTRDFIQSWAIFGQGVGRLVDRGIRPPPTSLLSARGSVPDVRRPRD